MEDYRASPGGRFHRKLLNELAHGEILNRMAGKTGVELVMLLQLQVRRCRLPPSTRVLTRRRAAHLVAR